MSLEIKMPALSPTMTHGGLSKWCVTVGAAVEYGDILAEIETDKTVLELESPATGVLVRHLYTEGTEEIPVGSVIAILSDNTSETDTADTHIALAVTQAPIETPICTENSTSNRPALSGSGSEKRLLASPMVKALARENDIDLTTIEGSGSNGRVIKQDVERVISSMEESTVTNQYPHPIENHYQTVKLSGAQKSIARLLQQSKQNIPHFYLSTDVELDSLLLERKQKNKSRDIKISINDFIVKACGLALREHPQANSHYLGDSMRQFENIDIAIATAVGDNLLTPVLRNADKLALEDISSCIKDLGDRAKSAKLLPEEYQNGTFTISNLGMFNVDQFDAIINPPQIAILAVGSAKKKPVVIRDDVIGSATIMTLTLSCDHRAINGANGAKFLTSIRQHLENPATISA